jgi:predicted DNA-binding protein with PD1-like motif
VVLRYWEDRESGVVIASLGRGDLLLESLRELAERADVHTGIVVSGIGSLSRGRIHIIKTNNYPPGDVYFDLAGPLEVVQFGGIIAGYQPHIHIGLWDTKGQYYGGHLEDGCEVLTLSEISIRRAPGLRLPARRGVAAPTRRSPWRNDGRSAEERNSSWLQSTPMPWRPASRSTCA